MVSLTFKEKYYELVELSNSENTEIKEKADACQAAIGIRVVDVL